MATDDTFVIVGAGLAGAKAAEALRADRFDGQITLLGTEEHRPYERPPLPKAYQTGERRPLPATGDGGTHKPRPPRAAPAMIIALVATDYQQAH